MALASLQLKVKLDPGRGRNVKSNVESDVDLSCSAVIFQQGLNLILGPQSQPAWAQENATFPPAWDAHWGSTNGKIVFLVCHFLFPLLSSPCPTLVTSRNGGQSGEKAEMCAHNESWLASELLFSRSLKLMRASSQWIIELWMNTTLRPIHKSSVTTAGLPQLVMARVVMGCSCGSRVLLTLVWIY